MCTCTYMHIYIYIYIHTYHISYIYIYVYRKQASGNPRVRPGPIITSEGGSFPPDKGKPPIISRHRTLARMSYSQGELAASIWINMTMVCCVMLNYV